MDRLSKHQTSFNTKVPILGQQQLRATKTAKQTCELSDYVKKVKLELAVSVAYHGSVFTTDHLGEIMETHGKNSTIGKIKLHRTKHSGLIKNVIGASIKNELASETKGQ